MCTSVSIVCRDSRNHHFVIRKDMPRLIITMWILFMSISMYISIGQQREWRIEYIVNVKEIEIDSCWRLAGVYRHLICGVTLTDITYTTLDLSLHDPLYSPPFPVYTICLYIYIYTLGLLYGNPNVMWWPWLSRCQS